MFLLFIKLEDGCRLTVGQFAGGRDQRVQERFEIKGSAQVAADFDQAFQAPGALLRRWICFRVPGRFDYTASRLMNPLQAQCNHTRCNFRDLGGFFVYNYSLKKK